MAQLHGQENESYIAELKAHTDKPVIKAFSIKTADDMEIALQSPADYILLDQGSGGTGKTFDWSLIPKIRTSIFSCRRNRGRESGAGDPGDSSRLRWT